MQLIKLIILLLLMAVGVVLTVLNSESVVLNYYFGSRELPLSVVLVAAVAFGALLGLVASLGGFFRLKRQNSELRRKAQLASQEINNLRSIPIKD
ncbi:MAG: LapA family protein [Sedimenticola sp.]